MDVMPKRITKTYRFATLNILQPRMQPSLEAGLQHITHQTRTHQSADVPAQVPARTRDGHLGIVDPCGQGDKRSARHDSISEAARANVQGLPDGGVSAPAEDQ